jgi:hypothetical protein
VFENRVLRKIFRLKRDKVTGEWRKLHNEKLHDLRSSQSIIRIIKSRRMRWAGHVARMGEKRNAYILLVRKPEGKRPLGRPRRRWVVKWSEFLATDPEVQVRFPALPEFLIISGSGTGYTQPREYN